MTERPSTPVSSAGGPKHREQFGTDSPRRFSRSVTKAWLRTIASWLPPEVRHALARELVVSNNDYEIFQILGRSYGVSDICIVGSDGAIEGSINDNGVLRAYGQTKTWANRGNQLFVDFFARCASGTYIDIGANIGLTTIPIAQNPAVSCKAFEPAPQNFQYLKKNVTNNCSHGNVEIFNLALFDRPTVLDFELSNENHGDHRVRVRESDGLLGESRRTVVQVEANRLDDLLGSASIATPLAVKIATQGAEAQVIAGGQSSLAMAHILAFEFWPYGIERANGDIDLITGFIRSNFRFGALIAGGTNEMLEWQPIDAVVERLATFSARSRDKPYDYYDAFTRKS